MDITYSLDQENYKEKTKKRFLPWIIWGLAASFFLAEYFARVAPSVMIPDLMRAFHVNAAALGGLSAAFYYAYISMQIPVGILVDRYGAHKLLTIMAMLCGLVTILFSMSTNIYFADASRFLMGFSAAFAFVGTLKLASQWFSATNFGLLSGLSQALGMLGASIGEGPMALSVAWIGWQKTMLIVGLILVCIGILIGLIVRDRPRKSLTVAVQNSTSEKIGNSFITVIKNPQTWLVGIYVGFLYAPTTIFAELWGVQFLKVTHHVSTTLAGGAISMIFLGWLFGGPVSGWISDKIRLRKPVMLASAICGLLLFSTIIYIPNIPFNIIYILMFLYGMTNTGVCISYAVANEINPPAISGTSMAFSNMSSVIIGALCQPLIGFFLQLTWSGKMVDGVPFYSAANYQLVFFTIPLLFLISIIVWFFIKETKCKSICVN